MGATSFQSQYKCFHCSIKRLDLSVQEMTFMTYVRVPERI